MEEHMNAFQGIDVFKSFITHFSIHETDRQVSNYVSVKFEEKREKTKL